MSQLGFTKKDNYTRCKNSAIYSLAMREHSRQELFQKLQKKEYVEGVDVNQLLNELEESNYLSEERFTESFIRHRASRGQGLIKISNELKKRGISSVMINKALDLSEVNWYENAKSQLDKKFGEIEAKDFKEKTKRMRFLSTRGFSSDIINSIIHK